MADAEDLETELRELGRNWAAKLAVKLEAIDEAARSLRGGLASTPAMTDLHFLLHRLAGSGTSFGYPQVTWEARSAEYALKPILDGGRLPSAEETTAVLAHLAALRQACTVAMAEAGVGLADPGRAE
jgi:hypothetical protein